MTDIPPPRSIEFDPAKDARNRRERGLSLALAALLIEAPIVEFEDTRRDYGEQRIIVVGLIAGRLHVGVTTLRGPVVRIISLRRAKPSEVRKWLPNP